jgi:hypothetical protein
MYLDTVPQAGSQLLFHVNKVERFPTELSEYAVWTTFLLYDTMVFVGKSHSGG